MKHQMLAALGTDSRECARRLLAALEFLEATYRPGEVLEAEQRDLVKRWVKLGLGPSWLSNNYARNISNLKDYLQRDIDKAKDDSN